MQKYSHYSGFTDYMKIIFDLIKENQNKLKILDIPAGNGLLAQRLEENGHNVICADINNEKENYVFADMNEALPFSDNKFDIVICMEGLEHLLQPNLLISELCRIVKEEGQIIISLPNIQNLYSRLQFLCTGTFYQFPPLSPKCPFKKKDKIDLGHISSLSYVQLKYLFEYYEVNLERVSGDRYKKKYLIFFLLPFVFLGKLWVHFLAKSALESAVVEKKDKNLFCFPLLFSRSLILVFRKKIT